MTLSCSSLIFCQVFKYVAKNDYFCSFPSINSDWLSGCWRFSCKWQFEDMFKQVHQCITMTIKEIFEMIFSSPVLPQGHFKPMSILELTHLLHASSRLILFTLTDTLRNLTSHSDLWCTLGSIYLSSNDLSMCVKHHTKKC